jgi:hypothetical protein
MNKLIDRMITRVQRPISPVEPLLSQLYVPHSNALLDSETDSAPAIQSAYTGHSPRISEQLNVIDPQMPRAQSATNAQPFQQFSMHQPIDVLRNNNPSGDPAIFEFQPRTLSQSKVEQPSASPRRHEQDSQSVQLQASNHSTAQHMQAAPEKDYPQLIGTHPATLNQKNERRGDQSAGKNQLPQATTTEVNISIGHIEVRAIQRAEPVRRSPPPPPSHVTLDDYLRRRSGASQ